MPAPRPDYNTPLDSANALNADVVFATWFGEDPADDTVLTDVSGNDYHGTLSGLEPGYEITVAGGTGDNAVYNQSYIASGTYGWMDPKPKYVSADGNYWCVYDDDMMCWVLMPANGWPDMDAVAYNNDQDNPWEGAWNNSFTVTQGDLQPGPWVEDGLAVKDAGYAGVNKAALRPGTGDFSVVWMATPDQYNAGRMYMDMRNTASPYTGWGIASYGTTFMVELSGASRAYFDITCSKHTMVADTLMVMAITVDRDGDAVVYRDGVEIGSEDISSASDNNVAGTNPLKLGGHHTDGAGNCFIGTLHAVLYYDTVLTPTQVADIHADIYALAEQSGGTGGEGGGGEGGGGEGGGGEGGGGDCGDAGSPAYVYWTDDLPGAAYGKLCIAEEDVQVVDDFGAVADQGWQLSVCDGALRYTAWFREGGCNLQGMDAVTFDFTDRRHRVRLECQTGAARLYVDGMLLQTGGAAGPTTRTVLAWGSWIPDDF